MAIMVLAPYDVVVVPFPFTDRAATKRRPALVLSNEIFNRASGHCVLAMITSAAQSIWQGDIAITEREGTGLENPCVARLKIFTLDQRLIIRKAGQIGRAHV